MPRRFRDLLTRAATATDEFHELAHEGRLALADFRDHGLTVKGTIWAIPVDLTLAIPNPPDEPPAGK